MKIQKMLKVKNKLGLHARPAALFVQTAGKFKSSVMIRKGDVEVNGKSMMGLMMLAAEHGSELELTIDGEDAALMLNDLVALFDQNFKEQ